VFDHVTIRVSDLTASRGFYERLFSERVDPYVSDLGCEWDDFSIAPAEADSPVTRRLGIVLAASAAEEVDRVDPDGNEVRIVPGGEGVKVDRLHLATRDIAAARRFYQEVATVVGDAAITFVEADAPTEHVHLAFGVAYNAVVDEFHRVALAAGYRDHGAPGERSQYHAGYYGAYVLDPDGHNVEAVCHNRN
jgi:catechol 2,3-dioxygenase-like lactoylglutathione lyase family enzyme